MRRAAKLYQKDYIRLTEGKEVDQNKIEKQKDIADIVERDVVTKEEALDYLVQAEEQQNKMIQKEKEFREKEILDYYYYDLANETKKKKGTERKS